MTTIERSGADELPEFLRDPDPAPRHYTIISVDDHLVEHSFGVFHRFT